MLERPVVDSILVSIWRLQDIEYSFSQDPGTCASPLGCRMNGFGHLILDVKMERTFNGISG